MDSKNNDNFPLAIVDLEPEVNEVLLKYFPGEKTGFIRVGPKGYLMPDGFREEAANIYNMKLREGDTFVTSFPRSGTTLTQELVWMVVNDLDYTTSHETSLIERYPFLELSAFCHPVLLAQIRKKNRYSDHNLAVLESLTRPGVLHFADAKSPRFAKTHLPLSLLPPTLLDTAKVVYVARDPRDVAVSYYHLNRLCSIFGYVNDFKTYWNFFIKDLQPWTPYFEQLKESWQMRHHPNMLFLFYEDVTKDLPAAVRRVAKFFNKQFTDEQVARLCDHLNIDNFKKNKSINMEDMYDLQMLISVEQPFVRKGGAGGWRDYFDEEMVQQAERWMADNLRGTDLQFPHLEISSEQETPNINIANNLYKQYVQ